jgi:site-specific DNA-methyltransferase (adenine-specific)
LLISTEQGQKSTTLCEKKIDNQKIILGDCLKVLEDMQDNSIDLVITSPPYNLGIDYNFYNDNKSEAEYLAWLISVFIQIKRTLREDGSIFVNVGCSNSNLWIAFDVAQSLRDILFLQNRFIWVKSISIGNATHGHFKPINSARFTNHTFEEIFHFTKRGNVKIDRTAIGVPYMDKNNIKRKKNSVDLRCRGNCWYIPYETINSRKQKGEHPAVFPKQLVESCIKLHGFNEETVVCDPFLGTGTTLMLTKQLGLKGIGIEIDQKYFDYTCLRLEGVK